MLRIFITIAFVAFAGAATAERRVALVMGADDYRSIRKLDNAVNDARSVEETLQKLGFEVTLETDRDLRRTRRAQTSRWCFSPGMASRFRARTAC